MPRVTGSALPRPRAGWLRWGAIWRHRRRGLDLHRSLTLETVPCERIVLYIYVIPHTLPRDNEIGGHPPFPLQVRIRYGDRTVLDKEYSINQWGGASIELKVSQP